MSREIKFRVWDNNCEQYCDEPGYIVVFGGGNFQMFNDSEGEWEENGSNGSDLILEQYTGKKDKVGEDIFNGDLCEIRYNNGKPPVLIEIIWSENHCCFHGEAINQKDKELSNYYSLAFSGSIVDGIYIVGNIHENEDLLK